MMEENTTSSQPGESPQKAPGVRINPQVVQLGPSILARVLDKYIETQPQTLQAMRHGLDSGSAEKLRDAAHSLKGSAATLGLEPMAELCRQLELAAREGDLDISKGLLGDILDEGKHLEDALGAYLEDLRQQP